MRGLRTVLLLCVLLLLGLVLFAKKTWPDLWTENYLYVTQTRKDAAISFNDLSDSWTEKTLFERLQGFPINCSTAPPAGFDRACAVDVKSVDKLPALAMNFFFKQSHLSQAFIHVPGWRHQQALDHLRRQYGPPTAKRYFEESDHTLLGWALRDGSAIFFNEAPDTNPLQWSTALWISATQCYKMGGCLH